MKTLLLLLALMSSTALHASLEEACKKTWIYFDLGNTLVNTKDNPDKITYMPEAENYLRVLKEAGCTLGLIVNIPQSFGTSYAEKLSNLKTYVDSRWVESTPFAWEYFEEIFVPFNNEDLKPKAILFRAVFYKAWMKSHNVLYQGETLGEIVAAEKYGLKAFLVGSRSSSFFLPTDEIPSFVK